MNIACDALAFADLAARRLAARSDGLQDPHPAKRPSPIPAARAIAPALVQVVLAGQAAPSSEHLARAGEIRAGRYTAIGETYPLGPAPDWRHNPSADAEWLIALHKLPFLVDLAQAYRLSGDASWVALWCEQVQAWLTRMGTGELASSDAQVEARRVEHLVVSLALIQAGQAADGDLALLPDELLDAVLVRVFDETDYLLGHLKPARNHRSFQLHAAYLASLVLGALQVADRQARVQAQRAQAFKLFVDNLLTDFGDDGVHVELSTHYHQITLELALSFAALARAAADPLPAALDERLQRALDFSLWTTLPLGGMPLVGDADEGDNHPLLARGAQLFPAAAPRWDWVHTATRRGAPPVTRDRWFDRAGYLVLRDGWGHDPASARQCQHVFVDIGALGAGSHAHYDLFSFCYSQGGQALVVDPGRYTYNAEADDQGIDWRHRFKRTAAHNTVCIDGLDQTRYFSKARRPAPGLHRLDRSRVAAGGSKHGPPARLHGGGLWLGGATAAVTGEVLSHEYEARHRRLLVHAAREYLLVLDRITSTDGHRHQALHTLQLPASLHGQVCTGRGRFAYRPGASGTSEPSCGFVALGTDWSIHLDAPGGHSTLVSAWVAPTYGCKQPAPALQTTVDFSGACNVLALIAPCHEGFQVQRIDWQADADGALIEVALRRKALGRDAPPVDCVDRFRCRWPSPATPGATTWLAHQRREGAQVQSLLDGPARPVITPVEGAPC